MLTHDTLRSCNVIADIGHFSRVFSFSSSPKISDAPKFIRNLVYTGRSFRGLPTLRPQFAAHIHITIHAPKAYLIESVSSPASLCRRLRGYSLNMATKSSPRTTRKRLRQSTLTNLVEGSDTAESRKRGRGISSPSRGLWNEELKSLMIYEPNSWKSDKKSPTSRRTLLKVAAFDLDSTLITTKSRARFPKSAHDWKLYTPRVASMLEELSESGYILVIFTNQAGVSNGRINETFVKSRLDGIMNAIKADIGVFVAIGKDNYRKPGTGMWEVFTQLMGGIDKIDLKNSFYVGDAAGRKARPGSTADFSDSDLRFSINTGLPFRTPEEYFLGRKQEAVSVDAISGLDPRSLLQGSDSYNYIDESTDMDQLLRSILTPDHVLDDLNLGSSVGNQLPAVQTMVLMHGFPASGKTSFVKRHLIPRGYVWINHDTMQTFARCSRATRDGLLRGKSIVVDNTNPDRNARAKYIELGKAHDASMKIIALSMVTPKDLAQHLNVVRERASMGKIPHVPFVAYHAHQKRAEEPDWEEGIDRIASVRFVPCFTSEQEKYMFTRLT